MKSGKWDIFLKVGCSPEVEKIERTTLIQRRDDSFMHWARLQNNNGNVSVSVSTVLRGMDWPGAARLPEQKCITFMFRKQRVQWAPDATQEIYLWGFLFHKHPGCIFAAANSHKEGHQSAKLPHLRKILCWFIALKMRKSASFYTGFWNDSVRREIQAGM